MISGPVASHCRKLTSLRRRKCSASWKRESNHEIALRMPCFLFFSLSIRESSSGLELSKMNKIGLNHGDWGVYSLVEFLDISKFQFRHTCAYILTTAARNTHSLHKPNRPIAYFEASIWPTHNCNRRAMPEIEHDQLSCINGVKPLVLLKDGETYALICPSTSIQATEHLNTY